MTSKIIDLLKADKLTSTNILCSISISLVVGSWFDKHIWAEAITVIISSALLFVILTLWFAWVRDVSDTWKSRTDMFGHPLRLLGAVITSVTLYFGYKHFLESGISMMDIARSESLIHFSAFLSFGLGTLRSSPQGNINNVA